MKIKLLLISCEKQKRENTNGQKEKDTDVVRREYIFKAIPWYQRSVGEHFVSRVDAKQEQGRKRQGKWHKP